MMESHYVIYRKLDPDDQGDNPEWEMMAPPTADDLLVKSRKLPGAFGMPDLFIAWNHAEIDGMIIHLCTYTNTELGKRRRDWLLHQAAEFVKQEIRGE